MIRISIRLFFLFEIQGEPTKMALQSLGYKPVFSVRGQKPRGLFQGMNSTDNYKIKTIFWNLKPFKQFLKDFYHFRVLTRGISIFESFSVLNYLCPSYKIKQRFSMYRTQYLRGIEDIRGRSGSNSSRLGAKRSQNWQYHFYRLRDRYGITQLLFGEELNKQLDENPLGREFVLQARGQVSERSNKNAIFHGRYRDQGFSFTILNRSVTPPLPYRMIPMVATTCVMNTGISICAGTR